MDTVCLNIVEIHHTWRILEYLEYCRYCFVARPNRWKGCGEAFDETVSSHLRSLDRMCFSDQFYFCIFLNLSGMTFCFFGLQCIIRHKWNLFEDPATSLLFILIIAICKAFQIMIKTAAIYLKIWEIYNFDVLVNDKTDYRLDNELKELRPDTYAVPKPLSLTLTTLNSQTEPNNNDLLGMQKYCDAFLRENELWLQQKFVQELDKVNVLQYRKSLLTSLTNVMSDIDQKGSQHVAIKSKMKSSITKEIDIGSPHHLSLKCVNEQRLFFKGSMTQNLMSQWISRSRFMIYISESIKNVKCVHRTSMDVCELCGSFDRLSITPIYTLVHLSNLFRRHRSLTPLWNSQLWLHFFHKFTPTCTICERCYHYFWQRNLNIPLDKTKKEHTCLRGRSTIEQLRFSFLASESLQDSTQKCIKIWFDWSKRIRGGREGSWLSSCRQFAAVNAVSEPSQCLSRNETKSDVSAIFDTEVKSLHTPEKLTVTEDSILKAWRLQNPSDS